MKAGGVTQISGCSSVEDEGQRRHLLTRNLEVNTGVEFPHNSGGFSPHFAFSFAVQAALCLNCALTQSLQ